MVEYSVDIDKNNLDEECMTVPALFDAFQKEESKWSSKLEDLKDQLGVVKADIGLQVRGWTVPAINTFFDLKLEKTTEDVFKNLSAIHPEVLRLMNEIAEARRNLGIFQTARKSIEQKASNLDRLAKLHGQGYFMKIEGRPYKKLAVSVLVKEASEVIVKRLERKIPRLKPSKSSASALDL